MTVFGFCDGVRGDDLYGWAWRPDSPDTPVDIDVCLDGAVIVSTAATLYRGDLRAAGIGHGRYGWRVAIPKLPKRDGALRLVVRARDGNILTNGELDFHPEPPLADIADPELQAFLAATLDGETITAPAPAATARPNTRFLLFSASAPDARRLGEAEYSYGFVLRAFRPLLERLGSVYLPADETETQAIVAEGVATGEATVRLFFGPPHRAPLNLPTVPVIAWEYATIPDRAWDGEHRHDWTFVLRHLGRAITLSEDSAVAIRAALGVNFPVIAVPTPVWDRSVELQALPAPSGTVDLTINGFAFDTLDRNFDAVTPIPAAPDGSGKSGDSSYPASITLGGFVSTAVLAPKDGRKSWTDILTAFIAALGDRADATLVFKMIADDPGLWWWQFHELLGKQRSFRCRIVVLHGYLDEIQYIRLIAATHWVANASKAEGQCLPLLEFLCGGRPAIAPRHTAMRDYIEPSHALIVATSEEYCGWPHDPANVMTTVRHRIDWASLRDRFAEAYRETTECSEAYLARGRAARDRMRNYCSDEAVAGKLDSFLGLGLRVVPVERPALASTLMARGRRNAVA